MTEFRFPDVAEGIGEGKLIEWKVKEGDTVEADQVLCEMETDKTVLELPSPEAGKIQKLHYKEGDTVPVGEVLVTFGEGPAEPEKEQEKAEPEQKEEKAEPEAKPEPKQEPEPEPEPVKKEPKPAPKEPEPKEAPKQPAGEVLALPKERRLAKEKGVDLSKIKGTGPSGRITAEDIEGTKGEAPKQENKEVKKEAEYEDHRRNYPPSIRKKAREMGVEPEEVMGTQPSQLAQPAKTAKPTTPIEHKPITAEGRRVPIEGIRKVIKEKMEESWRNVPHGSVKMDIPAEKLVKHRESHKERLAEKGIKLTFLPYIVRVVADALDNFPRFNASIDETTQEIVLKKDVNIGIAVDTQHGLIVPNIKECDKKSIAQIAKEIQDLAEKARDKKLSPESLSGGTFSITNVGSLGGSGGNPIINYPEVAILMVGRISEGKLPLHLMFDHRIIDGGDAARFLNFMKELLQDPQMDVEVI